MSQFLFFTKTPWSEPPRIRHQLAHLLAGGGHDVLFFEKPAPPWRSPAARRAVSPGITVVGGRELLHHKLRLTSGLRRADAWIARRAIAAALPPGAERAVIVNFNYDYWFLRSLFPSNRIVTMINDDFVTNPPLGITRHLQWALERTCRMSDRVLTVSTPLQERLAPYARAELFLPWADRDYRAPGPGSDRSLLLFWGFINRKINFPLVDAIARSLAATHPDVRILFAGPVEQGVGEELEALSRHPNVEVGPAAALDALPCDRVFASIIPYRSGKDIDAIMLPNKALQLLARGIPLVIAGMPHFISAPFVSRIDAGSASQVVSGIRARFDALQPPIREFVGEHTAAARLRQFESIAGLRGAA